MLIDADTRPEGLREPGLRWWENERFAIGWKGHLFMAGGVAGAACIEALAPRLEQGRLEAAIKQLYGVFGLFVHDKRRRSWQIACDHAGLYKIFHDERRVATRFLELAAVRGADAAEVDPDALVEFLAQGAIYGPGTFLKGVSKVRADEVIELLPEADGGKRVTRKALDFPAEDDTETVLRYFADLAASLGGRKLSADVTGGFDTRLIVGLLAHHGLDFEVAISGTPESQDVTISERVAALLGKPFFLSLHDVSRLEEDLPAVFLDADGQLDPYRFHRDRQNALARLGRGIEVMTHGGGGAHFKDFFAYQDFPRYNSPITNFERFYDLRITPVKLPPAYFTPEGLERFAAVRPRALARFESCRAPTNNESYGRLDFFMRAPETYGRYLSSYINMGLDVAVPYLERRNILVSFRIPPWERFMNGWHRRIITRIDPALAALPTTEGYTAAAGWRHALPNLLGYGLTQTRRVAKKASQRYLGKAMFFKIGAPAADVPDFIPRIRATRRFQAAIERLKATGLVAPTLDPSTIRDAHVGRMLNAGMLLEHLDRRGRLDRAA